MTYIAYNADLKNEQELLSRTFMGMDKNGDQRLTREELKTGTDLIATTLGFKDGGILLTDNDFETLFQKLDTSKSGSIGYTEYLAGAIDVSKIANEKLLENAFSFFDKDKSGAISKDEIRHSMKLGWISEGQLDKLMIEVDANKDNTVNETNILYIDIVPRIQEDDGSYCSPKEGGIKDSAL